MTKICYINGDGVGPELMDLARKVLGVMADYEMVEAQAGYDCFKKVGTSIPDETIELAKNSDAILLSAVSSPPETAGETMKDYKSAVITLRKQLDMYANVRPSKSYPGTGALKDNIDLTIVRENTEGLYAQIEWMEGEAAYAKRVVTRKASERVIRFAFEYAKKHGKKKVTVVHKANALRKTCGFFLKIAQEISEEYPGIELEDVIVDAMAMRLIKHPQNFEVIVTTNLFGDILSDESAEVTGGLGLSPSMNYGDEHAMFEPTHGSAPKYTGMDVVNPVGMIRSVQMMFDYLGEAEKSKKLDEAVYKTIVERKKITKDLGGSAKTSEMVDEIIRNLA